MKKANLFPAKVREAVGYKMESVISTLNGPDNCLTAEQEARIGYREKTSDDMTIGVWTVDGKTVRCYCKCDGFDDECDIDQDEIDAFFAA